MSELASADPVDLKTAAERDAARHAKRILDDINRGSRSVTDGVAEFERVAPSVASGGRGRTACNILSFIDSVIETMSDVIGSISGSGSAGFSYDLAALIGDVIYIIVSIAAFFTTFRIFIFLFKNT